MKILINPKQNPISERWGLGNHFIATSILAYLNEKREFLIKIYDISKANEKIL
jgi:hypothetical protein